MKLQLPKNAKVNKFIPKNKFYDKVAMSAKNKKDFINKVQKITWLYKISEDSIAISKTENIKEIEVFEIELKTKEIPKNILKIIDKTIPYPILYLFTYENDTAFAISLKENKTIKNYYFSEWNKELSFDFNGINLEVVYQKLIKAFIPNLDNEEQFDKVIEKDNRIKLLEKDIKTLKNKIKKEKQMNRKVDLNKILLEKQKELLIIK